MSPSLRESSIHGSIPSLLLGSIYLSYIFTACGESAKKNKLNYPDESIGYHRLIGKKMDGGGGGGEVRGGREGREGGKQGSKVWREEGR